MAREGPGRPESNIDWKKVDSLLEAGCMTTEIAAFFGISPDTLYNRCKTDQMCNFSAYSQEKKAKGESLLRAKQYETAMKGNVSMQIWLGKQRLNQRDSVEELRISDEHTKKADAILAQLSDMQSKIERSK